MGIPAAGNYSHHWVRRRHRNDLYAGPPSDGRGNAASTALGIAQGSYPGFFNAVYLLSKNLRNFCAPDKFSLTKANACSTMETPASLRSETRWPLAGNTVRVSFGI